VSGLILNRVGSATRRALLSFLHLFDRAD